jgi:hypothetical protein
VNDGENLDVAIGDAIRDEIRRFRDRELAGPGDTAWPAQVRMIAQGLDRCDDTRDEALGGAWIVAREVADRLQIG